MEEEEKIRQNNHTTQSQLIQIIQSTFRSDSQAEQRKSEEIVMNLLKNPQFIQKLYHLLISSSQLYQKAELDKAGAVLLKKFSYDYANSSQDRSRFIQMLFSLILSENVDYTAKEILGNALEQQITSQTNDTYRKTVIKKTLQLLGGAECLKYFQGLIIVCLAYMNSIVEIEDQIQFFQYSMQSIHYGGIAFYKEISQLKPEEWAIRQKVILPKLTKLFDYLETGMERIIDEEEYYQVQLKALRQNASLISLLQNYIKLFHNNGSIINRAYPQINLIKKTIINIVNLLFGKHTCPFNIFHVIYLTFLMECQNRNPDCTSQSILIDCISILSLHLTKKHYYSTYVDHLSQTIVAIFMYSTTTRHEFESLNNNPEQFSDIADYYMNADRNYHSLKVMSAVLVQVLVDKVDEAMKQLLQILILLMTGSIDSSEKDSQIMTEVKSASSELNIYSLNREEKLETSLMLLSAISQYVYRRYDIFQIIYAFFISQYEILTKISSPIVNLRLIRAISCYPSAIYFSYVENQISKGKVFALQGLKCFEKILKSNRYPQIRQYLAKILINLIDFIEITGSLMELIVIGNQETLLKVSPDLYKATVNKIKSQFFKNKHSDEHATCICFNYLYSLIKKEKEEDLYYEVIMTFNQIQSYLLQPNNLEVFQKYEDKLVEINETILMKLSYIPEQIDIFVRFSLGRISHLQKGSQYFKFYSLYVFKMSGSTYKLEPIFVVFWHQVRKRYQSSTQTTKFDQSIPYFCFLMSQIMANHCKIQLSENDLQQILVIADKAPAQQKQYPLLIFLTYLYLLPYPVSAFLKQKNLYEGFITEVVKVQFGTGLLKKILILALIKLLEIEEDMTYFKIVLTYCIGHLKQQNQKSKGQAEKITNYEIRPRKLNEEKVTSNEEYMQAEKNDNELANKFINFKHPYNSMSQYDQFKVIFWQNDQQLKQLSQELRNDLATILQTEWVDNKTRRIVRVKK